MLEKLNSIVHQEKQQKTIKQIVGYVESKSEQITLKTLGVYANELGRDDSLLVPHFYESESSNYTVCMSFVRGIRIYELIALLNGIIQNSADKTAVMKSFELKTELIRWAIGDLRTFQSDAVQNTLQNALAPILSIYKFYEKLIEALQYLSILFEFEITTKLTDEVMYICEGLSNKAKTTFRDATLKNRILEMPDLDLHNRNSMELSNVGDYYRPTNVQWTDIRVIESLLNNIPQPQELKRRIYNVDFESAYTLTTQQDDYIHIFTLEIAGLTYKAAEPFWSKDLNITEEEYNTALFFRCFREWVRRLFYKCERPGIYMTRYYHENLSFNFNLALDALQRLRQNSDKDHLSEFDLLMRRCQPAQQPWPWLLRKEEIGSLAI